MGVFFVLKILLAFIIYILYNIGVILVATAIHMKCKWCWDILDDNIDLCPRCWYKEWYWYWYDANLSQKEENSWKEYLFYIKWTSWWRLYLYDSYILIQRKWLNAFFLHWLKWDKQIPIKSITAIQIKKAWLMTWYIQFSLSGWNENIWWLFNAVKDENTVTFLWSDNYETALKIQEYINNYSHNQSPKKDSSIDEIRKLWELLKEWLITQEEFDSHKKKLLN